jgi:hypothetical protein
MKYDCKCDSCSYCRFRKMSVAVISVFPTLHKCCDCANLGDELTFAQREALQLPHGKTWHDCEAGLGPIAKCHQSRCERFAQNLPDAE